MRDTSLYENLPDDPELAFIELETAFREECESKLRNAHQDERTDIYYVKYISKIIATINELGLSGDFASRVIPVISNVDYSTYLDFSKDVEHYTTMLQIRHGRRRKEFSVSLDADAKSKLRQLLEKVKSTIDTLDVSPEKKEALHAKTAALEAEINQNRTRFDVVAALWVETCGKVGEGVEKLEPLRKWLDPIGNLIRVAKHDERTVPPRLPSPPKPKVIEDKRPPSRPLTEDIDDDIPF